MSKSILPFVALNAATSTGPGSSVDLQGVSDAFTLYASATGSPTDWRVYLELSHDGSNWFFAGQVTNTSAQYTSTKTNFGSVTGSSPPVSYVPHARYARANLTVLTGGTSPTVTATIAVGEIL